MFLPDWKAQKRSSHVSRNTNIYFEISIQESNMKMFIFLRLRYRQIASWTLNSFFTETRLMQKSLIAKIEHKFHHICDVSSFLQKIMMINNMTASFFWAFQSWRNKTVWSHYHEHRLVHWRSFKILTISGSSKIDPCNLIFVSVPTWAILPF